MEEKPELSFEGGGLGRAEWHSPLKPGIQSLIFILRTRLRHPLHTETLLGSADPVPGMGV